MNRRLWHLIHNRLWYFCRLVWRRFDDEHPGRIDMSTAWDVAGIIASIKPGKDIKYGFERIR